MPPFFREEIPMYILAAQFAGSDEIQFFFAKSKTKLRAITRDATDWRLYDDGWIDSKFPDSWQRINRSPYGELCRYVI